MCTYIHIHLFNELHIGISIERMLRNRDVSFSKSECKKIIGHLQSTYDGLMPKKKMKEPNDVNDARKYFLALCDRAKDEPHLIAKEVLHHEEVDEKIMNTDDSSIQSTQELGRSKRERRSSIHMDEFEVPRKRKERNVEEERKKREIRAANKAAKLKAFEEQQQHESVIVNDEMIEQNHDHHLSLKLKLGTGDSMDYEEGTTGLNIDEDDEDIERSSNSIPTITASPGMNLLGTSPSGFMLFQSSPSLTTNNTPGNLHQGGIAMPLSTSSNNGLSHNHSGDVPPLAIPPPAVKQGSHVTINFHGKPPVPSSSVAPSSSSSQGIAINHSSQQQPQLISHSVSAPQLHHEDNEFHDILQTLLESPKIPSNILLLNSQHTDGSSITADQQSEQQQQQQKKRPRNEEIDNWCSHKKVPRSLEVHPAENVDPIQV